MSHLRYFGLKCAGVSSGVSWFRRSGLARLWKELLYHVHKEIRREVRVPRRHGDTLVKARVLNRCQYRRLVATSLVVVEQQPWLRLNDMIADCVTD